jgi:hypothetical protein
MMPESNVTMGVMARHQLVGWGWQQGMYDFPCDAVDATSCLRYAAESFAVYTILNGTGLHPTFSYRHTGGAGLSDPLSAQALNCSANFSTYPTIDFACGLSDPAVAKVRHEWFLHDADGGEFCTSLPAQGKQGGGAVALTWQHSAPGAVDFWDKVIGAWYAEFLNPAQALFLDVVDGLGCGWTPAQAMFSGTNCSRAHGGKGGELAQVSPAARAADSRANLAAITAVATRLARAKKAVIINSNRRVDDTDHEACLVPWAEFLSGVKAIPNLIWFREVFNASLEMPTAYALLKAGIPTFVHAWGDIAVNDTNNKPLETAMAAFLTVQGPYDYFAVSSKWTDNGGMNWHEQFSKVRCGSPTALLPEVSGNGTLYVREFERCLVRYDSACAGPDGTGCGTITAKTDDVMSDVQPPPVLAAPLLPGLSIFPGHTAAVDCTCIPVLIAIPGRLIALTEERLLDCSDGGTKTIALRASDDGGQTFSPQVAVIANSTSTNLGGALWDNVTQTLLVTYTTLGGCLACDYAKWGSAKCNSGGCRNLWLRRSTDYGRTFLPAQNISGAIWGAPGICSGGNNCKIGEFLLGGPTKGVQLADGTLVMLVVALSAPTPGFPGGGLVSLRSTDSGLHWTLGTPRFVRGWSETSLTLLPGGELLANGRCGSTFAACGSNGANASRLFARSTDGGVTFGAGPNPRAGIRGAQCAGDTIALPDGTLIFSHPAGLEHVDDRSHGGSFVGNCFDYPRQVPGKRCSKLSECPFAGDAPCRSNLTIIASRDGGVNWTPWKQDFWEGFPAYPWAGGGALPFPARAGYSSLSYIEAKDSASGRAEVAIMFEATGEVGPQRLIRFDAMHASVIRDVRVPV